MAARTGRTPLQNRVTPWGELVSTPARGTLMGNRGGRIHDDRQRLTSRRWTSRRWICCLLEYKGWHRQVMQPHRYTELFFLDEATAFAAGHRPCALCRHAGFERFRAAWIAGNPGAGVRPGDSVDAIDRVLHAERLARPRPAAPVLRSLPSGAMVGAGDGGAAFLWHGGRAWRWSFEGYTPAGELPAGLVLLTPPSIVRALAEGLPVAIHASAE